MYKLQVIMGTLAGILLACSGIGFLQGIFSLGEFIGYVVFIIAAMYVIIFHTDSL